MERDRAMKWALLTVLLIPGLSYAQASRQSEYSQLRESVRQGEARPESLLLSLPDAIDRATKYNLGMLVSESETRVARTERVKALADLLPDVRANVSQTAEQISLAAYGFTGLGGIPPVVGPFPIFQAQLQLSQPIIDIRLKHELRRQSQEFAAANFSQQNVRELVVLVTADLYLEAVAGAARVDTARAQLKTAQAVYDRAVDLKNAGEVAAIDVLRAQVELKGQQQRVVFVQNELAKQKLSLAKAIGMPLDQQVTLTSGLPGTTSDPPAFAQLLETAINARPDYLRAQSLVNAGKEALKAAESRRLPTLGFNGNYSDIGPNPLQSHGTFLAEASLSVPLFQGGRIQAEADDAKAVLDRRKAEADSLQFRIEYDLRTAYLDIESAAEQVRVAQTAVELAEQQLVQARDRFSAGVADSLEVVQSQQAVAVANENYISSLFSLNIARTALARATGDSEPAIKRFFGGQ
jgi:outer membrane protein TolC